ncbi:MAG: hypothetical protein JNL96_22000 [Planctomycetaceae bacterium]|nr:hypothetical protein [Planctomycetaceae bacterium]
MPFPFYCPQGHLLEGHESQQGTPGRCPTCGAPFMFPVLNAAPGAAPPGYEHGAPQQNSPIPSGAPGGGGVGFAMPPGAGAPVRTLNLLCPNGHTVPTPEDLMGTTTICPYCNKPVEVIRENSVEYKRQLQQAARERDAATSRLWIRFALVAAALVVATFVAMFIYVSKNR